MITRMETFIRARRIIRIHWLSVSLEVTVFRRLSAMQPVETETNVHCPGGVLTVGWLTWPALG